MKYFKGRIHLNQCKYAPELLTKTKITLAKAVVTLLAQKHCLHEYLEILVDASSYRMIVGRLQYLTLTRPDISHVVNLASQFMQSQNIEHLQGVKRILRYVKGTYILDSELFHNHHIGCMATQLLIGEVVP